MTIGLFAPLPLAIMIPFMAAQSFAMGQAFGTSFQYGKRKISSMSNEEFNKLTAQQAHAEIQSDIRDMIPSMNQSFKTMEKFQSDVVLSILGGVVESGAGIIRKAEDLHAQASRDFREFLGLPPLNQDTNTQTDTSATNIDFSGGTFNVQGGNRGNQSFAEAQKAWDAYQKAQRDAANANKGKTTQQHVHSAHPHPTTVYGKPDFSKESRPAKASLVLIAKKKEKKQILTNIGILNTQIHNAKLNVASANSAPRTIHTQIKYYENKRRAANVLKDLLKKLANMNVQLKNYRNV